jgi:hypothetical protein
MSDDTRLPPDEWVGCCVDGCLDFHAPATDKRKGTKKLYGVSYLFEEFFLIVCIIFCFPPATYSTFGRHYWQGEAKKVSHFFNKIEDRRTANNDQKD